MKLSEATYDQDGDYVPPGEYILCEVEDCTNKIKNHAWGKIQAVDWFFSKAKDEAYCPDHIPDWVHRWRQKAALRQQGK